MKKRRQYGRRRRVRRRYRGRRRVSRFKRISRLNVHTYKRRIVEYINVFGNTAIYQAKSFNIDELPSSSEFTPMYDQYRILSVSNKFFWSFSSADAGSSTAGNIGCPLMYLINDYDDATVPTSVNELLQRPFCKTRRMNGILTHTLRPKATTLIGSTNILPKGANPWIDVSNLLVPHYGIKFIISPFGGTAAVYQGTIVWIRTYTFQMKAPR